MSTPEYDFINGHVREALGRIETKVDTVISRLDGHDTRLASVEKRQWFTAGGVSLAVAMLVPKLKTILGL